FERCFATIPRPPLSTLFPYTTLFRSEASEQPAALNGHSRLGRHALRRHSRRRQRARRRPLWHRQVRPCHPVYIRRSGGWRVGHQDRKSTRLNSSHVKISYAVFCLKKK